MGELEIAEEVPTLKMRLRRGDLPRRGGACAQHPQKNPTKGSHRASDAHGLDLVPAQPPMPHGTRVDHVLL